MSDEARSVQAQHGYGWIYNSSFFLRILLRALSFALLSFALRPGESSVVFALCHDKALPHELRDKPGQVFIREVVPAAAGVMLGLLDVAGQGAMAHLQQGQIP